MKADCLTWLEFLSDETAMCRPFMDFSKTLRAEQINFYTDTSGSEKLGLCCFFDGQWMHGKWGEEFMKNSKPSIEFLELYAVTVGIIKWADNLVGKCVIMYCDMSLVDMINNSGSSCRHCMILIRKITLKSLQCNTRFFASNVRTEKNVLADALSRHQMSHFWRSAPPNTRKFLSSIPEELWTPEHIWLKPF